MKLSFSPADDDAVHLHCTHCQCETVSEVGANEYRCSTCSRTDSRVIMIDPAVEWWLEADGEYCHATAGIFVADEKGRFLFFDRSRFPFGLTVPAGHVDKDEDPAVAAMRELGEETGLDTDGRSLITIGCDALWNDSCRRGADMHRWHSFMVRIVGATEVTLDPSEGSSAMWLTLEQALELPLTPATGEVIERNRHRLETFSEVKS